MAKVVVVTPIYANKKNNRLFHFLDRTYPSVINQTYDEFLWIIIDDGSPLNIKSSVEREFPPDNRVVILKRKRKESDLATCSNAVNYAIDHLLGPLTHPDISQRTIENIEAFTLLHSDDSFSRDSLADRVAGLTDGALYTSMWATNYETQKKADLATLPRESIDQLCELIWLQGIPYMTLMWKLDFIAEIKAFMQDQEIEKGIVLDYNSTQGIWDPRICYGEDKDVALYTVQTAKSKHKEIVCLPDVYSVYYTVHEDSITGTTPPQMRRIDNRFIRQKHLTPIQSIRITYKRFLLRGIRPWSFLPEPVKKELRPFIDRLPNTIGNILSPTPYNLTLLPEEVYWWQTN